MAEAVEAAQAQLRGGGGGCLGKIPQTAAESLFFSLCFWKIPLVKPATPYKDLGSYTAQLSSQTGDCPGQGPSRPTLPSLPTQSVWVHAAPGVCHFILIPPSNLKHPGWSGAAQTLFVREGAVDLALSQESCSRGCRAWGCSHPCPRPGPQASLGELIVPKHSPYHMIFQCPPQFGPPLSPFSPSSLPLLFLLDCANCSIFGHQKFFPLALRSLWYNPINVGWCLFAFYCVHFFACFLFFIFQLYHIYIHDTFVILINTLTHILGDANIPRIYVLKIVFFLT